MNLIDKDGISKICSLAGVKLQIFNLSAEPSEQEIVGSFVNYFKTEIGTFRLFLYNLVDYKIRDYLNEMSDLEKFEETIEIGKVFPEKFLKSDLKILKERTGLTFPTPILSRLNFWVQITLFVIPCVLFVIGLAMGVEFLLILYGVVKFAIITFLLFLPYGIVFFLFPRFYRATHLVGIRTYKDFIDDVVDRNLHYYKADDFHLTKKELIAILRDESQTNVNRKA
jgi:hypothetical protein